MIVTTPDGHEPRAYLVLGNDLPCAERGVGWLGVPTGIQVRRAPPPRPHVSLADECYQAADGNGLAALTLAVERA